MDIPFKNPYVFTVAVDDSFSVAVNPLVRSGYRVINRPQLAVLQVVDGQKSISDIAQTTGLSVFEVDVVLKQLGKKGFVAESNNFPWPKQRSLPNALSLWIHSTNRCTLRCSYCHVHQSCENMTEVVWLKLRKVLIETAQKRKLKKVTLRLAGGEPMMQLKTMKPHLSALKKELREVNCQLRIAFLTNLTILTDEAIVFIKEYKCGVSVSMDGVEQFHDQTRIFPNGRGSYHLVMSNLQKLLANGIRPYILTVVSNTNLDGLESFTRKMLEMDLGFRYSFVKGESLDLEKLLVVMKKCYALIEEYIWQGYNFSSHRLCDISFKNPTVQACGAGRSTASIFSDGQVFVCQNTHHTNDPIGSIFASDCDLVQMIGSQTEITGLSENDCHSCQFQMLCSAGCPLEKKSGRSPYCQVFQELIPLVYRLKGVEQLVKYLAAKAA